MAKARWKESVVYQIYPRSFMDSDGDGIGDLPGIVSKLDYLKELGVDVVWLSPVYDSPNDDNGYDIRDYRSIMQEFGTMEDWRRLRDGLHERGMKLIMDLVVNHTSDEHPWFAESRKSKDNPYRDFYYWRPGEQGREPNNWVSYFSGSAWEYDEATEEYYLHLFSRKQPDLNWENPKVREEVYGMMEWWLEQGVDGFRMDVINCISKVDGLPSVPGDKRYDFGGQFFIDGPRVHEFLQEMNRRVLSRYETMTVGETPGTTPQDAIQYANAEGTELNMVFHFDHMNLDAWASKWDLKPWQLRDLKHVMTDWQKQLEGKAWNSLYLNNHDQPRMVSRFGNDAEYRVESAKMLATFLHTLQGTPYIYQGEELGMTNVKFASLSDYKDIEILNMYHEQVNLNKADPQKVMLSIYAKGRDNARTPMQWEDSAHAGFTTGTPWLGVNPNYTEINAKQALADPDSIFHYYRRLLQLRKEVPILVYGTYDLILPDDDEIYAYTRTLEDEQLLVVLNFSVSMPTFKLPDSAAYSAAELLIANYEVPEHGDIRAFSLKPYEARVYRLRRPA